MNQELQALQREIDRDFGIYQSKFQDLEKAQKDFLNYQKHQDDLNLIMAYFNKLVDSKRKEVMDKVIGVVTQGLQMVFQDPSMKLVVKERLQRNQKFYILGMSKDGIETTDWNSASGGGRDIVIFMLRVVFLVISSNRRFLVLDEPFSGLSIEYRENLIEFLQVVAEKFDIQLFIVTHIPEINAAATNLYQIRKINDEVSIIPVHSVQSTMEDTEEV